MSDWRKVSAAVVIQVIDLYLGLGLDLDDAELYLISYDSKSGVIEIIDESTGAVVGSGKTSF